MERQYHDIVDNSISFVYFRYYIPLHIASLFSILAICGLKAMLSYEATILKANFSSRFAG